MRKILNWLNHESPIPDVSKILYDGSVSFDTGSEDEEIINYNSFSSSPSYSFVSYRKFRVTFPEDFPVVNDLPSVVVLINKGFAYVGAADCGIPSLVSIGSNYVEFKLNSANDTSHIDIESTSMEFVFTIISIPR